MISKSDRDFGQNVKCFCSSNYINEKDNMKHFIWRAYYGKERIRRNH